MTRPATIDEARARLSRLDGGLRLDEERTPPSWTAYVPGVGRGDGETWEAAWDAMVARMEAVWAMLHEAPEPLAEVEALRRQVAELQALGVSLHKAAAAGMADERAAVVKYLRPSVVDGPIDVIFKALADHIERGVHRP